MADDRVVMVPLEDDTRAWIHETARELGITPERCLSEMLSQALSRLGAPAGHIEVLELLEP